MSKIFKKLKLIDIENNNISDISVLKDLTELEVLHLSNTEIKDISIFKKY